MIWALHGALGSADDWRILKDAGSENGLRLQAVDLWQDFPRLDFPGWSADLCETVAARDPEPILLGYSLGGRLALHALLARPDLWKAAIIVSAHTGLPPEERPARAHHDAEWARRFRSDPWKEFLDAWDRQLVFAEDPRERGKRSPRHENMIRSFTCWSLAEQEDLLDRLPAITCPILWITGAQDEKFTAIARHACEKIPKARHVVAENCGHRVPWQWVSFSRSIESWVFPSSRTPHSP